MTSSVNVCAGLGTCGECLLTFLLGVRSRGSILMQKEDRSSPHWLDADSETEHQQRRFQLPTLTDRTDHRLHLWRGKDLKRNKISAWRFTAVPSQSISTTLFRCAHHLPMIRRYCILPHSYDSLHRQTAQYLWWNAWRVSSFLITPRHSVTHDSLRYINILTYLLTYLLTHVHQHMIGHLV